MTTAIFLLLAIAGALGATVEAAHGGAPIALGGFTLLAFVGLAGAAASAAVALGAPDDVREPREARGPTHPPPLPTDGVTRKVFGRLWFAALGAFAVLGFVPLVSLARRPGRRVRTGWRPGIRLVDAQNVPISVDRLDPGGVETVFPENGVDIPEAPALLIRLESWAFSPPPDRRDWSPDGYIAFSKICTHAGCPVALYRHESHQLYCPCHQSVFDVLDGAKNISGPAPRPLPQLALDIDRNGHLIARGDFAGPVGPDDWDRTI